MTTIGFSQHDHHSCIAENVAAAEAHCVDNGLQFTTVRRRVLEILLQEHRALGAYEILDRLRDEGLESQPPIAYRALDFLVKIGFAHKIERLNAFIACAHPKEEHAPAFLICQSCDSVAEAHAVLDKGDLAKTARAAGFRIERTVVEAEGICPNCALVEAASC
ncbi:MAG: transcriptional repressor [Boseongicola sp.]|nr:MAG: transcriptional repressor [Boseongicola sp.]